MDTANIRWPGSLWAAVTPPGPDLPRLTGTAQADVVVIGGGFTGLSTALHLREAGVDVAIVEAMEPGWGASGLNNGQVIPTLSRRSLPNGASDLPRSRSQQKTTPPQTRS